MAPLVVGVVGNPNCGKTTLFNRLTGARQQVGNWPGVTVERKTGLFRHAGAEVAVVDLPGIYSLSVTSAASVDETIARDWVLSGEADLIVNIVDASNLERNLYLTIQLLEMRVPMVVALNMMDAARDRRIEVDAAGLSRRLGCAVVPLIAHRGDGVERLKAEILKAVRARRVPTGEPVYSSEIESEIEQAVAELAESVDAVAGPSAGQRKPNARWLAIKLLEDDAGARRLVGETLEPLVARLQRGVAERAGEDADILIADGRYGFANALIRETVRRKDAVGRTVSDRIDRVVLNRVLGIPIFLAVMYLLFTFTINVARVFQDFFGLLSGALLVEGLGRTLTDVGSPPWLTALLADGVGGGVQTVATFIPMIGCLYLFLSFLEDSGYMARAAFVMDRFMRTLGLPGKSFIPLIVGFGCNVPAIMATRTLENRRERIITVMMAPFMSCGARLPVYALFVAAFFPTGGQNLLFALYLIGIGFAVTTDLVLKSTLLAGETAPFVMELPPYHVPTGKSVLLRTWDRLKGFVLRAGKVIVAVVVALNFLNSWGIDGSFGNQDTDRSMLAGLAKTMAPVVEPMGVREDNWPATVGLLTGVLAKETVVGTLNALYSSLADDSDGDPASAAGRGDLWAEIGAAFATIPANAAALVDALADPLGLRIAATPSLEAAAEEQNVAVGAFGAMAARFDGRLGAFAYLLAVLLYMPCVSAVAAIHRETGGRWAVFASLWTTGLGYGAAVLTYQIGTFAQHPSGSAAWIGGIVAAFFAALAAMRRLANRDSARTVTVAAE